MREPPSSSLDTDPAPFAVGRLRQGPRCRHLAHAAAAASGAAWRRRRGLAFLPRTARPPWLVQRPAAYWAAWADALPVLHQRRPDVAARCGRELLFEEGAAGPALREAAAAARSLEAASWEARPAWPALSAAPDLPRDSEITEPSDLPRVGKGTLLPHGTCITGSTSAQAGAWLAAIRFAQA